MEWELICRLINHKTMAKKASVKKSKEVKVKKKPGRKPGQVYPSKKKEPVIKMDISVSELTEQQKHDAQRDEWLAKGN